MIACYLLYIILMAVNSTIEKWAHATLKSIKKRVYPQGGATRTPGPNESTPLHTASKSTQSEIQIDMTASNLNSTHTTSAAAATQTTNGSATEDSTDHSVDRTTIAGALGAPVANGSVLLDGSNESDEVDGPNDPPWERPEGKGIFAHIWWLLFLPINTLFYFTIPDVRRDMCANLFPVSFAMCMAWIGAISYVVTWMITIIGDTISVPDTVMGLSFLAVGTSIPEVFSSLIVSKQVGMSCKDFSCI